MYHLVDNFQDKAGNALVGYYVKLKVPGGAYATLYADENLTPIVSVSGVADTAVTDANGMYDIYVDEGDYETEFFDKADINQRILSITSRPMFANTSATTALGQLADTDGSGLVGFIASGASAVARTIQAKARDIVSARDFGVVGDNTTDDTAALQALFDSGLGKVTLGRGLVIKITDTVTIPVGLNVDWDGAKVVYSGTRDRAAIVHGAIGSATEAWLKDVWVEAGTTDISSDTFVGLKIYNAQRCKIDIHRIAGFTRNIECVSRGQGFTGVRLQARFLGTCKYALTTTCDAAAFNYINSNQFIIEEWTNVSALAGDTHGWHARGIAGASTLEVQNGNLIHFHGLQPGNGSGGETRNAALIEGIAGLNTVQIDRYESGRGVIATVSGPVGTGTTATEVISFNKFRIGLLTDGGGAIVRSITETGSARANFIEWMYDTGHQAEDKVTDLVKKVKAYSPTKFTVTGGAHMTVGDGLPRVGQSFGGIETDENYVRLGGADRSIGRFIDIEGGETFMVWAACDPNDKPKLGVAPYDASGARLATSLPGTPLIISDPEIDTYNRWTSNMGGCYQTGSGVDSWIFRVDTSVKRLRYFVQGGRVSAFGIRRLSPSTAPLSGFSGLETNDATHYLETDPAGATVGVYSRGDIAVLETASGAGLDAYQCTLGGRYAPDWAATTAYSVGQLRHNGGNIYKVVTAGTSAGTGGPTGTGTGIADGTVVWDYLTSRAAWTLV